MVYIVYLTIFIYIVGLFGIEIGKQRRAILV